MTVFHDNDAVIVAYARTPIGRAFKGNLAAIRAEDLLHHAAAGALERASGVELDDLEDFIVGCAEPHREQGGNIARRVAVLLGSDTLPGTTVNRFCASSVQATRMAFHAIRAGEGDAYLVGGVEQISRSQPDAADPHPAFIESGVRATEQLARDVWTDPRIDGLLPDYYLGMGATAEFVARSTGTTREDQDAWALSSQQRAHRAAEAGFFAGEILPLANPDGAIISVDDSPRSGTTAEGLAALAPVFSASGTVTAGNACPLNDGASALVVTSGRFARERGVHPLARVLSSAVSALSPEIMGLGPIDASRIALDRAGLTTSALDLIELNEAFAAQVVPTIRTLGLDPEKVNVHGGAIALGHPYGATGARLIGTLARGLAETDGTTGLATLCIGGGQGMALVLERLS